jgi:DNA-binding CsgD family transcriptional regulator
MAAVVDDKIGEVGFLVRIALTPKQKEILRLLRSGKTTNKAIAFELGTSEGTIKVHFRNMFRKYGVDNRTQLLIKFLAEDEMADRGSNMRDGTRAFVLGITGTIRELPHREPTLEELQAAVGGYIEILLIRYGALDAHLVFDEEGKLKGKLVNRAATMLARSAGIALDDYIVGDAVVLTGKAMLT